LYERHLERGRALTVLHLIINTYFTLNKTFSEFRELMNRHAVNPLRAFSEHAGANCRRSV